MKNLAIIMFFLAAVLAASASEPPRVMPTNAPAKISLRDQFEMSQTLAFPTTNIVILTIADKQGSEQITGWVTPIKDRFGARVEICGIADMSAVPGWLRSLVRRKFQKAQSHPVMLDWSGDTVKAFGCTSDQVNVFLLNDEGRILKRIVGPATEAVLRDLFATIDHALASKDRVAEK